MIERYSRPEMKSIWELETKFQRFLDVELAVCEAYNKLGEIPDENLAEIKSTAKFDVKRIDEIEAEVRHDVIAFLTNVNENVPERSNGYIHRGLTSSDVIDTANALLIRDASKIILDGLDDSIMAVRELAFRHKDTVCIGRSHGIQAEVITFGLKLLNWVDVLERAKRDFEYAVEEIRVGQISGPVGSYSNVSPEVERLTCEILGLKPARISTQVIARDIYARFMQSLAMIATVIEQFATEIRHLQRSEVREVEEGFGANQKGSSAMPHKRNPVLCENLCGLARVVRSNSMAAMENVVLWHERDISHSSAERIVLADNCILVDFMLNRFAGVVRNLVVIEKNMSRNANSYGGIIYSQKVLLKLVEKGLTREVAYRLVQRNALSALDNDGSFKDNLLSDAEVLELVSQEELLECFDMDDYLKNIPLVFKRFE